MANAFSSLLHVCGAYPLSHIPSLSECPVPLTKNVITEGEIRLKLSFCNGPFVWKGA